MLLSVLLFSLLLSYVVVIVIVIVVLVAVIVIVAVVIVIVVLVAVTVIIIIVCYLAFDGNDVRVCRLTMPTLLFVCLAVEKDHL